MFITYNNHRVFYHQYGTGKDLMIAFHGFADKGNLFEQLATTIYDKDYTTVAIDLPFHGKTEWEGDIYRPSDVQAIVLSLMQQFGVEQCSMMCHSMGGRVVLGLLPLMAAQLKQLYFFAPAGFQYTFSASSFWCPLWFRKRSRNRFEESEGVLRFFDITHKVGLMNRQTYLVFKQQLDLPRRRARLLQTWVAMYYFPMEMTKQHQKILNEYEIPSFFYYGKKDRITPAKAAQKVLPKLKHAELHLLNGNHFFVRDGLAKQLEDLWSSN